MKHLPVILGVCILAGALGLLLLWKPPAAAADFSKPALDHVRGRMEKLGRKEGSDFELLSKIISQDDKSAVIRVETRGRTTSDGEMNYYLLKTDGKEWTYDRDLYIDFETYVQKDYKNLLERLGQRLVERFRAEVKYQPLPAKMRLLLAVEEGRLIASLSLPYEEGQGRFGSWMESYRWEKGAWVSEGGGRQVDLPGHR